MATVDERERDEQHVAKLLAAGSLLHWRDCPTCRRVFALPTNDAAALIRAAADRVRSVR